MDETLLKDLSRLRELGGYLNAADDDAWVEFVQFDSHHSTAIEGNALSQAQVDRLLDDQTAGTEEIGDYLEVMGYAQALEHIRQLAQDAPAPPLLTVTDVRRIHELALGPVWTVKPHPLATANESPGAFRRHDINVFPGGMKPPDWTEVPRRLTTWVSAASLVDLGPYLTRQLATLHAEFERIHPFLDGNGRVGRLTLNLMMLRLGCPPIGILETERAEYLQALRDADRGNPDLLCEILGRRLRTGLEDSIDPFALSDDPKLPLVDLADGRMSAGTLRNAANRGRLVAEKSSAGRWLSTRGAVDDYLEKRYRRDQERIPK